MVEIAYLSEASFDLEVLQSKLPVIVDFTAEWCGPCKMLEPIVKQLAHDWQGKASVFKLNVDDCPNLAEQLQVMGVPTLILFVDGQAVARLTGYQPKDKIVAKFLPHL